MARTRVDGSRALEVDGSIEPVILPRESFEPAVETALQLTEGVCRDVREDAAVMAATGFGPGDEDVGEVGGVVRDRHPSLLLREREQNLVVELSQIVAKAGGDHVVARLFEDSHEPVAR